MVNVVATQVQRAKGRVDRKGLTQQLHIFILYSNTIPFQAQSAGRRERGGIRWRSDQGEEKIEGERSRGEEGGKEGRREEMGKVRD